MAGVLDGGILGVSADMLSDMDIIAVTTPPIPLEFVVRISYAVDVLTVLIIDVVSVIGVEMLANENSNGLVTVICP